jgi:hypothetical protein
MAMLTASDRMADYLQYALGERAGYRDLSTIPIKILL